MGEPVEVLSALCNGLIRPEPLRSRFVGLFVTVSMMTTGHATGLEKTLLDSFTFGASFATIKIEI